MKATIPENNETQFCDTAISILGYREDDEWVALALEMDLRGYGSTFHEALKELIELIGTQISFAEHKGQPDMIFHPAASTYYSLFAQVRDDHLRSRAYAYDGQLEEPEYLAGGIPMPSAHDIDKYKKNGYDVVNG